MLIKTAENKQKQKIEKFIIQIIMVSLASIVGGFAFKNFFEPAGIIPTGLSGLSLLIHNWILQAGANIPISVIYLIINAIMFAFALKLFGWK